jgi:hypothetical protein
MGCPPAAGDGQRVLAVLRLLGSRHVFLPREKVSTLHPLRSMMPAYPEPSARVGFTAPAARAAPTRRTPLPFPPTPHSDRPRAIFSVAPRVGPHIQPNYQIKKLS